MVLYILTFIFLDSRREDKRLNWIISRNLRSRTLFVEFLRKYFQIFSSLSNAVLDSEYVKYIWLQLCSAQIKRRLRDTAGLYLQYCKQHVLCQLRPHHIFGVIKFDFFWDASFYRMHNKGNVWDFKFSRRRVWSSGLSSGMYWRAIALMMEAARTSETSVDNYFTRQYIPEDKPEQG
jgi:hypothetical protein